MEVVNSVMKTAQKVVIESDKLCPNCGRKMLVRTSRFGNQFLGCSGYPECKNTKPLKEDEVKQPCPKCFNRHFKSAYFHSRQCC